MKRVFVILYACIHAVIFMSSCQNSTARQKQSSSGAFESPIKWGEHLVTVSACHDCHSPKNLAGNGLDLDSSRVLSGHAPGDPEPQGDLKMLREKGEVLTVGSLTSWSGPWGTSYAANLTSDATGIGNWTEDQFMIALRKGKYKGMENGRDLLPPMPWQMYQHFTDDEIRAIFAYLKSTKPVRNIVPAPKAS